MDVLSIVEGLRQQRSGLDEAISALEGLEGGGLTKPRRGRPPNSSKAPVSSPTGRRRRTMSFEARAKIAAAQRKRWAKQKGEAPSKKTVTALNKSKTVVKTASKKASGRRGMSPAARKRMSDMMKQRWAARKRQT